MPYFSFSLKKSSTNSQLKEIILQYNLKPEVKYFSKNTKIWKTINKKNSLIYLNNLKFEKRNDYTLNKKSILFLIPPNIGLGDSIEYSLAIKKIIEKKLFKKIGIGFVDRYKFIFLNIFKFHNIFDYVIEEKILNSFDTIFHFSKEIKKLKNQKFDRSDIEKEICKYFNIRNKNNYIKTNTNIKKITLFPISTSPIRTFSTNLINSIIENFNKKIKIEVVFDDFYPTSKYLLKKINKKNCEILFHKNLKNLFEIINNIDYGIFIDSGPLHVAKLLNKKGLFIETSVSHKKLLNKYKNIETIKNNFISQYCSAPCGLTNLINFNKSVGCYQTLKINKKAIRNLKKRNSLQRGILINNYNHFMDYPVGCVKNINIEEILKKIENLCEENLKQL